MCIASLINSSLTADGLKSDLQKNKKTKKQKNNKNHKNNKIIIQR